MSDDGAAEQVGGRLVGVQDDAVLVQDDGLERRLEEPVAAGLAFQRRGARS